MKRVLKWIGIGLAGLVGLLLVAAIVIFVVASLKLGRTYEVEVSAVAVPDDEAALERGEHLVRAIAGCDGCHGDNLGGMVLLDEALIMTFYGPNLTGGEGRGLDPGHPAWRGHGRQTIATNAGPELSLDDGRRPGGDFGLHQEPTSGGQRGSGTEDRAHGLLAGADRAGHGASGACRP